MRSTGSDWISTLPGWQIKIGRLAVITLVMVGYICTRKALIGVCVLSPVANCQCFVDQNSYQPAAECAFVCEFWRIARCCEPAAVNGILRLFVAAEHTTCDEIKQGATAKEPGIENCWLFLQTI
jgi:hypothetical protein